MHLHLNVARISSSPGHLNWLQNNKSCFFLFPHQFGNRPKGLMWVSKFGYVGWAYPQQITCEDAEIRAVPLPSLLSLTVLCWLWLKQGDTGTRDHQSRTFSQMLPASNCGLSSGRHIRETFKNSLKLSVYLSVCWYVCNPKKHPNPEHKADVLPAFSSLQQQTCFSHLFSALRRHPLK